MFQWSWIRLRRNTPDVLCVVLVPSFYLSGIGNVFRCILLGPKVLQSIILDLCTFSTIYREIGSVETMSYFWIQNSGVSTNADRSDSRFPCVILWSAVSLLEWNHHGRSHTRTRSLVHQCSICHVWCAENDADTQQADRRTTNTQHRHTALDHNRVIVLFTIYK